MAATYEALIEENRPALERLARRLSRTRDDADDLLQESLLDAYRSFERFRPGSHFYNWFARIMTNNQLDRIRRTREATLSLDSCGGDDEPGPIEVPDERSNPERLVLQDVPDAPFRTALDRLEPNQRATVLLCDLEGATYEEAAAATRCPIGTIRSRLHRAHKSMERTLRTFAPRPEARQTRREFLAGAAVAGVVLAGVAREVGARPADLERVACPPALQEALGTRSLAAPAAVLADLHDTSVLVVRAEDDARLTEGQLAEIRRHVRDRGMGLVVLHSGESRVLRSVFGTVCGWDESSTSSECSLRITAPRHPVARSLDGRALPTVAVSAGSYQGPRPEVVVFGAHSAEGTLPWVGATWNAGRGRVCCLRLDAAAVSQHPALAQVFRNAVEWCAA